MMAVLNREDESSWVLEETELVVFDSCLQRPKDVIFEGLNEEGLVMMKKKKKCREKLESLRGLKREWKCENENECVSLCVFVCMVVTCRWVWGDIFVSFVLIKD